jgi:hypothetical protein
MRFRDFKLKGSARTGVAFKYPSCQSKSYSARNYLHNNIFGTVDISKI